MGRLWRSLEDVDRSVEFIAGQIKVVDGEVFLDSYVVAMYRYALKNAYPSHSIRFFEGLGEKSQGAVAFFQGIQPKEGKGDVR
jgi:hypothetical protein